MPDRIESANSGIRPGPDQLSGACGPRFPRAAHGYERVLRPSAERGPGAGEPAAEGSAAPNAAQSQKAFAHGVRHVRAERGPTLKTATRTAPGGSAWMRGAGTARTGAVRAGPAP